MPVFLALLSSGLWGTADFLGGTVSRARPVVAVVAGSQLAGLLLMLIVATVTRSWGSPPDYLIWAAIASLSGVSALAAFYSALAIGHMGVVSPITATGVVVPLAAGLATGQAPAPWQAGGIVLAIGGVVLASGPEIRGAAGRRPVVLALAAAVLFGVTLTALARGAESSAVMTVTAMRGISVPLCVLVAVLIGRPGTLKASVSPAIAIVGIFDVTANLTFALASETGVPAVVAVLGSLYPVVTVLLAWWLHHERLSGMQYGGVAAALAGVALIAAGG